MTIIYTHLVLIVKCQLHDELLIMMMTALPTGRETYPCSTHTTRRATTPTNITNNRDIPNESLLVNNLADSTIRTRGIPRYSLLYNIYPAGMEYTLTVRPSFFRYIFQWKHMKRISRPVHANLLFSQPVRQSAGISSARRWAVEIIDCYELCSVLPGQCIITTPETSQTHGRSQNKKASPTPGTPSPTRAFD